jgi:hypothetical protein
MNSTNSLTEAAVVTPFKCPNPECGQNMRVDFMGRVTGQEEPGITYGMTIVCDNENCFVRYYSVGAGSQSSCRAKLKWELSKRRHRFKTERKAE